MKNRTSTWLAVIVLALGALLAAIVGLFAYMSLTAAPIHSSARDVPSVVRSTPSGNWTDAIERARQIARASVTSQNLPGLSVAVGTGGEIVWAEGYGWADVENHVKVAPDTRFGIGMASKVLTSAAVGLLIERHRLSLDDEIRKYVPMFPAKPWPITLRQLMAHVAGVRTDAGDEGPLTEHCDRTIEGLRLFADRSLLFEPGTQYRYSNYGWILVSEAVETAGGEPFFAFMRTQVFEPLGMRDTMADAVGQPSPARVKFYFPRFAADPRYGLQEPREVDYSCFAGSGAFVSTSSDLVRFGMAMEGDTLLQPATVRLLQTPQRLPSGQETGYGLGWDLEKVTLAGRDTLVAGHDGEIMGGTVASLMTLPEYDLVVAVMSNTAFADTFSIGAKIAEPFVEHARPHARR